MLRNVIKETALTAAEHHLVLFVRLLYNIDSFYRHVRIVVQRTRSVLSDTRWRLELRRLYVVKVCGSLTYGTALRIRHRLPVEILLALVVHLRGMPDRLRSILNVDKRCVLNGVGMRVERVDAHGGLVHFLHALGSYVLLA